MEVELLRPGSIPISPETILWFEFLLDPDLLLKHLKKLSADPPPSELITKFYDVISETLRNNPDTENGEILNVETNITKTKPPAKTTALKILSLKVGAFLKWNLVQIRNLPFKTQISLLQDLMYFTNDKKTVEIPNVEEEDVKTASPPYLFALLLFHRWLLSTSMHRITSNWQIRYGINDISMADESIICCPENINKTVNFLTEALDWEIIPSLLTFDCFKLPTESNDCIEFDWSKSEELKKNEFCTQINYDLGVFFFYREQYDLAKKHFSECLNLFADIPKINGFYDVDKQMIDVYIKACHGSADIQKGNLLEQLNSSIVNQYMGITNILQQDNVKKEIPLMHRINLELNIQGALSSGVFTVARDLIQKIKALNIIRCVLDRKPLYQYTLSLFKNTDTLLWAIQCTWKSFSFADKQAIKMFLLEEIIKGDIPDLLPKVQSNKEISEVFDKFDLAYIQNSEVNFDIPENLIKSEALETNKRRKPKLEMRQLEKQLIVTNDHVEIKEILVKIAMMNLGSTVWSINPQWELPIPLQSVIKSLPRGFVQDFSYVILAKSKEQLLSKNFNLSLEFLVILEKELQASKCNVSKLFKLVSWEILLVQIAQILDQWPVNSIDKAALADACEVCLQTTDSVLPRSEVVEQCVICLLNLGRWEFLTNLEKKWTTFEIPSAVALACQELTKQKSMKKLSKNLWDLVLPMFVSTSQSKRNNSGFNDNFNVKTNVVAVFFKLKDTWCLTAVISMLTKMFNIIKDENGLELQTEYCNLWPATVSNSSSYNVMAISEILMELVMHALKHYPNNVAWLRLMGDINFANGHYQVSLNYYLKSLLIFHDYFNIPIRNDDHVFRRMIKCCMTLGANTQAAVLCQFLEETDYMLAFRILSEPKTCNDAVDAYYHCFWDTSILEYLISIHNKKGEFQRRKIAIQVIGMLELNSNNNEEIQREASNLRKSTFLRAMCKQYVF
ncbi:integrator complex subunit 8 [Diorhabda sublineata]|uniref:integrator complex subunit 8 n=1 Tax=Diorhabda sublineata TaxID=1163346 RepID=UPI0024E1110D|nr:integrator complex subunit 8 [Diorhabda sublineata]